MPPIKASYNSWVDIPECGFARTGYAFSEWACETGGEYTIYSDQDRFLMPDGDVVLSAQWAANSYTISFDPGGGSGSMDVVAAEAGSSVTLPACAFTRSGYVFDIWECIIDGEENYFND